MAGGEDILEHEEIHIFCRKYNSILRNKNDNDIFHNLEVAGTIRQLIIDKGCLLHKANQHLRQDIKFIYKEAHNAYLYPMRIQILLGDHLQKDNRVYGPVKSSKLDEFLKLPVLKVDSKSITVRQIVKYASNQKGGIHFSDGKTSEDKETKSLLSNSVIDENSILLHSIVALKYVVHNTLYPLAKNIIDRVELRNLQMHYKMAEQLGSSLAFCKEEKLESNDLEIRFKDSFAILFEIHIQAISDKSDYCIYSLSNGEQLFEITMIKNFVILVRFQNKEHHIDLIRSRSLQGTNFVNNFISLGLFIERDNDNNLTSSLFFDQTLFARETYECSFFSFTYNKQIVGTDIHQKKYSEMLMNELIVSSNISLDEFKKYIIRNMLKWR